VSEPNPISRPRSASFAAVLGRALGLYAPKLSFDAAYHRWNMVHAAVVTLLVLTAEVPAAQPFAMMALALWSALALGVLFLLGLWLHPSGPGPALPNLLTTARVVASFLLLAVVAGASFFPQVGEAARSSAGWLLFGILMLVELTDFFDGRIARRLKAGPFGSTWDMESDSIYVMALAVAVRHLHGVGFFVLLIGLMRYLYVLLWQYDGVADPAPRLYKLFAKTTTAALVITLIVAMAPVVGAGLRAASLSVVLGLQTVSFGWDILLQRRTGRLEGESGKQAK
jgi:phosphatidylglycerophosphate synthase